MKRHKLKSAVLEQLRKTPIVEIACKQTGVGRTSFYQWKKDDPEFSAEVDRAMTDGVLLMNDMAEGQLIAAIKNRDLRAVNMWLKNHHPSYRTRLELAGKLEVIEELSSPQKELIRRALALARINLEKNGS
ncbi:hypothetical protein IT398_02240 [Candidatus Nomurabacteria bacterium]|nr:hypothetical protein [Candidatus Nomurabacteria bacterium]